VFFDLDGSGVSGAEGVDRTIGIPAFLRRSVSTNDTSIWTAGGGAAVLSPERRPPTIPSNKTAAQRCKIAEIARGTARRLSGARRGFTLSSAFELGDAGMDERPLVVRWRSVDAGCSARDEGGIQDAA
jgi:hypothetical protein